MHESGLAGLQFGRPSVISTMPRARADDEVASAGIVAANRSDGPVGVPPTMVVTMPSPEATLRTCADWVLSVDVEVGVDGSSMATVCVEAGAHPLGVKVAAEGNVVIPHLASVAFGCR